MVIQSDIVTQAQEWKGKSRLQVFRVSFNVKSRDIIVENVVIEFNNIENILCTMVHHGTTIVFNSI